MASALGDKYELLRQLAVGGMGEIFLAHQRGPKGFLRPVVVKRILKHLAADQAFVEQFLNEGRLAARISHPNVVQILELDQGSDDTWYLVLEYVHGVTLRNVDKALRARGERLPLQLSAWLAAQALHGLSAAHELKDDEGHLVGLVHRDVSPDNLMLGYSGAVKVLDFGIAKATASVSTTRPGTIKGKIPYMAPEVISGDLTTPAADLYAMGVVLYELAAGRRPFVAQNEAALLKLVLEGKFPPLAAVDGVDPAYAQLVERALASDPAARFPSARAMAFALEQYAAPAVVGMASLSDFMERLYGKVPLPQLPQGPGPLGTLTFERSGGRRPQAEPSVVAPATTVDPQPPRRTVAAAGLAVLALAALGAGAAAMLRAPVAAKAQAAAPAEPLAGPLPNSGLPDAASLAAAPELDGGAGPPPDAQALRANEKERSRPARGWVQLYVQPWAEVSLGKQRLGVTPMGPISLPPGRHLLRLSNPKLRKERLEAVVVEPGRTRTVRVDLLGP